VTLFLFCLSAGMVLALGGRDRNGAENEAEAPLYRDRNGVIPGPVGLSPEQIAALPLVRVTGRVRLVGSEPMAELVISSDTGEWYMGRDVQKEFMRWQQRTVTVEGREERVELRFANGRSAGTRRILHNITLIDAPPQ
jgi:hypothetical protein